MLTSSSSCSPPSALPQRYPRTRTTLQLHKFVYATQRQGGWRAGGGVGRDGQQEEEEGVYRWESFEESGGFISSLGGMWHRDLRSFLELRGGGLRLRVGNLRRGV